MLNSLIRAKIEDRVFLLKEHGLNELVWDKEDAQDLIHSLMDDKIGIIGGTVYQLSSGHWMPLADNWSCEQNESESEEECHFRSKSDSLRYLENYPEHVGERVVFSIVFTDIRALNMQEFIRYIFMKEWDPIGVSDIPEAHDEYDSYILAVYEMVMLRKGKKELFDYLWWVETEHMGLSGDRKRAEYVIERIVVECDKKLHV